MIVQNISADNLKTDVTFTVKRSDFNKTIDIMNTLKSDLNFGKLISNNRFQNYISYWSRYYFSRCGL